MELSSAFVNMELCKLEESRDRSPEPWLSHIRGRAPHKATRTRSPADMGVQSCISALVCEVGAVGEVGPFPEC